MLFDVILFSGISIVGTSGAVSSLYMFIDLLSDLFPALSSTITVTMYFPSVSIFIGVAMSIASSSSLWNAVVIVFVVMFFT